MFIHSVYFTTKEDLTDVDRETLEAGLKALVKAPTIMDAFIGMPASTDRPVIDKDYDYALVVRFADKDSHDAYQVDAIHDKFRADCSGYWSRVRIFDAVS